MDITKYLMNKNLQPLFQYRLDLVDGFIISSMLVLYDCTVWYHTLWLLSCVIKNDVL